MKSHQVRQASANLIEMQEQIKIGCRCGNLSYLFKIICQQFRVKFCRLSEVAAHEVGKLGWTGFRTERTSSDNHRYHRHRYHCHWFCCNLINHLHCPCTGDIYDHPHSLTLKVEMQL